MGRTDLNDPASDFACLPRPSCSGGSLMSSALHDLAIGIAGNPYPGLSPSKRLSGPIVLDRLLDRLTSRSSTAGISSGSSCNSVGTGGASSRSRKLSPASDSYLLLAALRPRFELTIERVRVRERRESEVREPVLCTELASESVRVKGAPEGRGGVRRGPSRGAWGAQRCMRRGWQNRSPLSRPRSLTKYPSARPLGTGTPANRATRARTRRSL